MYCDIIDHCSELIVDGADKRVLCISGDGPLAEFFNTATIDRIEYPQHDVCDMPEIQTGTYNYIICDQVLEHVKQPFHAVDEMYRVLSHNTILILTTVFMYPIHEHPKDYWRFSPEALRELCKDFSEIIQCSGWGNQAMFKYIADRREKGKGVGKYNEPASVSMQYINNPDTPMVTWVVARK